MTANITFFLDSKWPFRNQRSILALSFLLTVFFTLLFQISSVIGDSTATALNPADPNACIPEINALGEIVSFEESSLARQSEALSLSNHYNDLFEKALESGSDEGWLNLISELPYYLRESYATAVAQKLPTDNLRAKLNEGLLLHFEATGEFVRLAEEFYTEIEAEGVLRDGLPIAFIAAARKFEEKGIPAEYAWAVWGQTRKVAAMEAMGDYLAANPRASWNEIEATQLTPFFNVQELRKIVFHSQYSDLYLAQQQLEWTQGWAGGKANFLRSAPYSSDRYDSLREAESMVSGITDTLGRLSRQMGVLEEAYPEVDASAYKRTSNFTDAARAAEAIFSLQANAFQYGYLDEVANSSDAARYNEFADQKNLLISQDRDSFKQLEALNIKRPGLFNLDQLNRGLTEARRSGRSAFQLAAAEGKVAGEAWYETLFVYSLPRFVESLTVAAVGWAPYSPYGILTGDFLNFDQAGERINSIRNWTNKNMPWSSVLGSDPEFLSRGLWSLASSAMPITNLGGSVFGGALGAIDAGIDGSMMALYDLNAEELAHLRQTDPYFKASRVATDIGVGSLALAGIIASGGSGATAGTAAAARGGSFLSRVAAFSKPASIEILSAQGAQALTALKTAGGISFLSVAGQEIYEAGEHLDDEGLEALDRISLERVGLDTLTGTTRSLPFQLFVSAGAGQLARRRFASELSKVNGGRLTPAQLRRIQELSAGTGMLFSKGVDIGEAMSSDFGETADMWAEANNWAQFIGAGLVTAAFLEDTTDASQVAGYTVNRVVRGRSVDAVDAAAQALTAFYGDQSFDPSILIHEMDQLARAYEKLQTDSQANDAVLMSQLQAVLEAHEVGVGQIGADGFAAGLGNYTNEQLRNKLRVLTTAGISSETARWMLREGIAGKSTSGVLSELGQNLSHRISKSDHADRAFVNGTFSGMAAATVVRDVASERPGITDDFRGSLIIKAETLEDANAVALEAARQIAGKNDGSRVIELNLMELALNAPSESVFSEILGQFLQEAAETQGENGKAVILVQSIEAYAPGGRFEGLGSAFKAVVEQKLREHKSLRLVATTQDDGLNRFDYSESDIRRRISEVDVRAESDAGIRLALADQREEIGGSGSAAIKISDSVIHQVSGFVTKSSDRGSYAEARELMGNLVAELRSKGPDANRKENILEFLYAELSRLDLESQRIADAIATNESSPSVATPLRDMQRQVQKDRSEIRKELGLWNGIESSQAHLTLSTYDFVNRRAIDREGRLSRGQQLALAAIDRAHADKQLPGLAEIELQNQVFNLVRVFHRLRNSDFRGDMQSALNSVYEAHLIGQGEAGRDGGPAVLGNYTNRQLADKSRLMAAAEIPHDVRKWILDEGIAGEAKLLKSQFVHQWSKAEVTAELVGRDTEIQTLAMELAVGRSAILRGKPGIQPLGIARELYRRYQVGDFPLRGKPQWFSFNLREVMAHNEAKAVKQLIVSQFAEMRKAVGNEKTPIIVVIPQLDQLIGSEKSEGSGEQILSALLAVLEEDVRIQVIASSDSDQSNKLGLKLRSEDVQFTQIEVKDADPSELISALEAERSQIESEFKDGLAIKITDGAIAEAARLSKDGQGSGSLLAYARTNLMRAAEIARQRAQFEGNIPPDIQSKISDLQTQIRPLRDQLNSTGEQIPEAQRKRILERVDALEKQIFKLTEENRRPLAERAVTAQDVRDAIKLVTGQDQGDLESRRADRAANFEQNYNRRVVGQPHVGAALQRRFSARYLAPVPNSKKANQPVGVFLFPGIPGVGKTYSGKIIQQEMMPGGKLIQINMAEYQSHWNIQRLTGADPGTVGYGDKTPLHQLAENPDSVLVLDEIGRGAPEVVDLFLDAIQNGFMTLADGTVVPFNRAVIIMTTNQGQEEIASRQSMLGRDALTDSDFIRDVLKPIITGNRNGLSSAMWSRIGDSNVIPFGSLEDADLAVLADLQTKSAISDFADKDQRLTLDQSVNLFLAKHELDPEQGPRQLERVIDDLIYARLGEARRELKLSLEDFKASNTIFTTEENGRVLVGKVVRADGSILIPEWRVELDTKAADDYHQRIAEQRASTLQEFDTAQLVGDLDSSVKNMILANGQPNQQTIDKLRSVLSKVDQLELRGSSLNHVNDMVRHLWVLSGINAAHIQDGNLNGQLMKTISVLQSKRETLSDSDQAKLQPLDYYLEMKNEQYAGGILTALDTIIKSVTNGPIPVFDKSRQFTIKDQLVADLIEDFNSEGAENKSKEYAKQQAISIWLYLNYLHLADGNVLSLEAKQVLSLLDNYERKPPFPQGE